MSEKTIKLEIVSPDRLVFSEDAYSIIAPGTEGYLGVLPRHAHLITTLRTGELRVRKPAGERILLAISGGFMNVSPQKVTILADAAERAEEVDVRRAEAAKNRALERLRMRSVEIDLERARAALYRALNRLKVAEKVRVSGGH